MARVFITGSSDGLGLMAGRASRRSGPSGRPACAQRRASGGREEGRAEGRSGRRRRSREHRRDEGPRRPGQRARAFRRGHSQRRCRLSRSASRDRRRRAACLRHQHARALYPHRADRSAEAARLSELGHARARETRISTISCGASGPGTGRRPTPRASCTTSCWLSPSRASGRMCCRMR